MLMNEGRYFVWWGGSSGDGSDGGGGGRGNLSVTEVEVEWLEVGFGLLGGDIFDLGRWFCCGVGGDGGG